MKQQIKVTVREQKSGGFKPVLTYYEWPKRLYSETLSACFVEKKDAEEYGEKYREYVIDRERLS